MTRARMLRFTKYYRHPSRQIKACNCEGIATRRPLRLRASRSGILSALSFFCSKILRFGKFRVATTNAGHVTPRPLVNNKLESMQLQKHCISNAERHCARHSGLFGLKILFSDVLRSVPGNRHVELIHLLCAMRMRVVRMLDALTR